MSSRQFEDFRYELMIAGVQIDCCFSFEETYRYFGFWLKGPLKGKGAVRISDSFWKSWTEQIGPRNAYNEYSAFANAASHVLLEYDRCLIHAVALRHRGGAWLITAPSGVGKSTQAKTLTELYPEEFGIISGDRPAIERTETGFLVHPSPWNGKEGWHGASAAPLKGIVCLERGEENKTEELSTKKAAAPVYAAVIQVAENEEDIRKTASFAESILKSVPVWKLTSNTVPESTRLLYDKILKTVNP